MTAYHSVRTLLALAMMTTLVMACGGDSSDDGSDSSNAATSSNSTSATSNGTTDPGEAPDNARNNRPGRTGGMSGTTGGTSSTSNDTSSTSNDTSGTSNGTTGSTGSETLQTNGSHNILLIIGDDIGVDNVSGYDEHEDSANTPEIDSLASSGVMFRNTWVNPMCSPSRASIYTGRHAYNHGVLHPSESTLDSEEETIAEILQAAGYNTALFGKWHLGTGDGSTPIDQGYDYWIGADSNLSDYFAWTKHTMDSSGTDEETTETTYATTVNVDDAMTWISSVASDDAPWMVTMAFNAPHSPFHVPPSDLYSDVTLSGSEGDACSDTDNSNTDCYKAAAEAMDTKIGELIAWLDSEGELDNTLVIFIGDNGTPGNIIIDDGVFDSEHGKTTVYEGGVNVPFVIYGPSIGVEQGVEIDDLVQGLDIFETVREIANGAASQSVNSQSLIDYLTGDEVTDARDTLYTEIYSEGQGVDRWAITNGTAKHLYIEGTEECYNLNNDPGESTERYDAGGQVTTVCTSLSNQRPCLDDGACPGE